MPRQKSNDPSQVIQRQQALSRWDNEGGAAGPTVTPVADKEQIPAPEMSTADLVVVCDHGDMVGVLTKTDIVSQIGRCMGAGCTARVDSIMTRDVTYCRTHEILLDVWSVMRERGLQRVPILDEARKPLGIIYAREALQALLSEVENEDALLRDYISGVGYR